MSQTFCSSISVRLYKQLSWIIVVWGKLQMNTHGLKWDVVCTFILFEQLLMTCNCRLVCWGQHKSISLLPCKYVFNLWIGLARILNRSRWKSGLNSRSDLIWSLSHKSNTSWEFYLKPLTTMFIHVYIFTFRNTFFKAFFYYVILLNLLLSISSSLEPWVNQSLGILLSPWWRITLFSDRTAGFYDLQ